MCIVYIVPWFPLMLFRQKPITERVYTRARRQSESALAVLCCRWMRQDGKGGGRENYWRQSERGWTQTGDSIRAGRCRWFNCGPPRFCIIQTALALLMFDSASYYTPACTYNPRFVSMLFSRLCVLCFRPPPPCSVKSQRAFSNFKFPASNHRTEFGGLKKEKPGGCFALCR